MRPSLFYGQRNYPNASHDDERSDDSDLIDSDEDPDYTPPLTTPHPPLLDSSSSESDDDPSIPSTSANSVPSTSANSTTQRLISKTIQNEVQDQYVPPTWQSQLSIPNEIKSPIEQFKYFFDDNILDQIAHESNLLCNSKES